MDVETLIFIGVFVAIGVMVVGGIALGMHLEKKRREAMQKIADEMGLPFYPDGDSTLLAELGSFHLFSQGRSKKIKNMLHGDTEEVALAIFDYQFTTGSGKNSTTWKQTVISFRSPQLHLPQFAMRPQSFFHKIGKIFGVQDIDFETYPVFSKNFILQGADEQAIRRLFRPELLEVLERKTGVSLEGQGNRLVFFRHNHRSKPEQIRELMAEGFELFKLICETSASEA